MSFLRNEEMCSSVENGNTLAYKAVSRQPLDCIRGMHSSKTKSVLFMWLQYPYLKIEDYEVSYACLRSTHDVLDNQSGKNNDVH